MLAGLKTSIIQPEGLFTFFHLGPLLQRSSCIHTTLHLIRQEKRSVPGKANGLCVSASAAFEMLKNNKMKATRIVGQLINSALVMP